MSIFEHVSVFVSIILGLAVAFFLGMLGFAESLVRYWIVEA